MSPSSAAPGYNSKSRRSRAQLHTIRGDFERHVHSY